MIRQLSTTTLAELPRSSKAVALMLTKQGKWLILQASDKAASLKALYPVKTQKDGWVAIMSVESARNFTVVRELYQNFQAFTALNQE